MIFLISILYFAAMYAIKGGWLGMIPGVKDLRAKAWIYDRLLDGKVASTIGVFLFFAVALQLQLGKLVPFGLPWHELYIVTPGLLAAAWLIGVAPSMGEEAGAIGRIGRAWGEYVQYPEFGRAYGVKKALQRGVWLGAPFTVLTGLPHFILLGLLFPVIHFAGQQIYYMIHKADGWKYAEPLVGGVCIGIGVGIYLN